MHLLNLLETPILNRDKHLKSSHYPLESVKQKIQITIRKKIEIAIELMTD